VGTLGVAGYLAAAEEVRRLARGAGKRTHTLLMGKPSPAKLANFPEVDVFVMVADAQVPCSGHNVKSKCTEQGC
jgi:diphthamide biosynthesis protein 2